MTRSVAILVALAACSRTPETKSRPPATNTKGMTDAAPSPAVAARAVQLALGSDHTCVLLSDGTVRCWGLGADGRLGTGDTTSIGDDEPASQATPVALGGPATAIDAGAAHTCALMATKRVRCWGRGIDGQLGYGNANNVGDDETHTSVGDVPLSGEVGAIAAGSDATCALLVDGTIRCWGRNRQGNLGYDGFRQPPRLGDDEPIESLPAIRLDRRVVQIAMDRGTTCVLFDGGAVRCWGEVLGSIDPDHAAVKRSDIDVGAKVKRLDGATLMCAITAANGARCWGAARVTDEQVGVQPNTGEDLAVLADVGDLPLPGPVEQIALSGDHGCALLAGGEVRCWGDRRLGILGVPPGAFVGVADAVAVELGGPASAIAVGAFHSCAITAAGRVRCWGMAAGGRLGYGTNENVGEKRTPAEVGDVPL